MKVKQLVLLGMMVLAAPMAANADTLLYSTTYDGGYGGTYPASNTVVASGAGFGLYVEPPGFSSTSCLGCAINNSFSVGTYSNVMENPTAQNDPNYANFVSALTSSNPGDTLFGGVFLVTDGTTSLGGAGGSPVPPSLIRSVVDDVQITINNFSFTTEPPSGPNCSLPDGSVEYNIGGGCVAADFNATVNFYGTPAVPLPAAVWLMLSGLCGLGLLARRRPSSRQGSVGG